MTTFTLILVITLTNPLNLKTTYTTHHSKIDCLTAAKHIRLAAELDPHPSVANIYASCHKDTR